MGQKTGDVLERYINTNTYSALKSNYRKALPYLAITEEVVMEENLEAIEKISQENIGLKNELVKMQAGVEKQDEKNNLILGLLGEMAKSQEQKDRFYEMKKQLENLNLEDD